MLGCECCGAEVQARNRACGHAQRVQLPRELRLLVAIINIRSSWSHAPDQTRPQYCRRASANGTTHPNQYRIFATLPTSVQFPLLLSVPTYTALQHQIPVRNYQSLLIPGVQLHKNSPCCKIQSCIMLDLRVSWRWLWILLYLASTNVSAEHAISTFWAEKYAARQKKKPISDIRMGGQGLGLYANKWDRRKIKLTTIYQYTFISNLIWQSRYCGFRESGIWNSDRQKCPTEFSSGFYSQTSGQDISKYITTTSFHIFNHCSFDGISFDVDID